jgi:diguanylate cyclase (GGDEF)-like protein
VNPAKLERLPEVLFEIGKAIGSNEHLASLLSRISELVCELTDAEACSIMLLDVSRERLLGKAAYGLDRRDIANISFRIGEGVAGWVAQTGEVARIDDVTLDPRYKALPDSQNKIRSLACVPLDHRDGRAGVVTLTSPRIGAFGQGDVELLGFIAKTMALDVENIRLRRVAVTDPLTGAFNREYLHQRLPQALEQATQRREPIAVAMIDIDHFKDVNDSYGHSVGDRVLTEVAARLRGTIRGDDQLVRYGGEEFLVLLPRADVSKAAEIGERLRTRFEDDPVGIEGRAIPVRLSIGVAQHVGGADESAHRLIERADSALYEAKTHGRNRVAIAR